MVMAKGTEKEFKLKPMKCELNYLSKSDGSAILAQGETVACASANGPLDIKLTSQLMEKTTLEVIFNSKGGKPTIADRYKENAIRQTCDTAILGSLYPRSAITVTVQELEDLGGLIACCVNCVCLALINSGVAMNYVFAGVSCAVDEAGNIDVDPTCQVLESSVARMTFVFESRDKSLVTAFTEGTYSEGAYKEAIELCRAASDTVFAFYRDIVHKYSNVLSFK